MLRKYFAPALMAAVLLTGCQAPQGKFSQEQVAAMKSYGFTESDGDWSLGLSDSILFDKNDYHLRSDSQAQIQKMASRLASTGITHARLDGHTDNYGEEGGQYPAQQFNDPRVREKISDRQQRYGERAC